MKVQVGNCVTLTLRADSNYAIHTKNSTTWYMANCGMPFLTKVIHNWLSEVRSVVLSWDQRQDTINS